MGSNAYVILNGEPLEEVDCFKYLWSQVTADRECERDVVLRMSKGYSVWGVLKSVLSSRIGDKRQEVSICRSNSTNDLLGA